MLTMNEIFERVATHMLTQKAKSLQYSTMSSPCAYRGTHYRKCAVGCLIEDQYYESTLEGCSAVSEEVRRVLAASGVIPTEFAQMPMKEAEATPHVRLLSDLQAIHDMGEVSDWETLLRFKAKCHGVRWEDLEIPPGVLVGDKA